MANLRVRSVSAGAATAKLRLRRVTVGGVALNNAVLRVQNASFSGPALSANARLRVFEVDVSGSKSGILTASTTTPASGEAVSLSYSGGVGVAVTWRVASTTNGAPPPVIVASGFGATVVVPAVIKSSKAVIGAKQGTGAEQTITLTISAAERLRRRSGVVIPVAVYVQRADPVLS